MQNRARQAEEGIEKALGSKGPFRGIKSKRQEVERCREAANIADRIAHALQGIGQTQAAANMTSTTDPSPRIRAQTQNRERSRHTPQKLHLHQQRLKHSYCMLQPKWPTYA